MLLVHVMLVLAYAYRLRVYLYELGQRVLQPARDRSRTSLTYVEIRILFGRQFARGIHRCSRLIDYHIMEPAAAARLLVSTYEVRDYLFRFSCCRAVSARYHIHIIFVAKLFQSLYGFCDFVLRSRRIDDCCLQYLSCRITHGQLAAGSESRVPSENGLALDRRLHKKLLEV